MFLALVHFWWEFRLLHLHQWKFIYYIFIIFYVTPYTLLFPDNMDEYASYRDYFVSRRKWFFGLLATTSVLDIGDTLLKGREYFESFGIVYPLRNAAHFMLCLVAHEERQPALPGRLHGVGAGLPAIVDPAFVRNDLVTEARLRHCARVRAACSCCTRPALPSSSLIAISGAMPSISLVPSSRKRAQFGIHTSTGATFSRVGLPPLT